MGAAGQFQAAQEFGDGGHLPAPSGAALRAACGRLSRSARFVAFLCGAKLAEHEPVAHRPPRRRRGLAGAGGRASRADQRHGSATRSAAAAQGLSPIGQPPLFPSASSAVEGDDFAGQRLAPTLAPGRADLGELRGIQRGQDPPEGVVAGNAVGQFEQAAQPFALSFAELLHLRKAFRTAEQRADRNDQEITARMAFGALNAWVGELTQVFAEAVGIGHPELLPTQSLKVHL